MNERVEPKHTAAISRDLKKKFANKKIFIENVGVRRVNDLMGSDNRRSLDLAMNSPAEAMRFGRKQLTVTVLE